jgi:hypothetical protein
MSTMIPLRFTPCQPDALAQGKSNQHLPDPDTVETESGPAVEWQYAKCIHCDRSIARFRILRSGGWFDRWGHVPESAYLIGDFA